MSGPKTATWSIRYDPMPARIKDLESYVDEQRAWLERNEGFIRRYLGEAGLAAAQDALDYVDECIENQDPDTGFDAYGDAWRLFHDLRDQAREAKRREENAKQTAEEIVAQCHALWNDRDRQTFLRRWINREMIDRLRMALGALSSGKPFVIQKKARQWQRTWHEALSRAEQAAQVNAKALRDHLPKLRAAVERVQNLNARILPDNTDFEREKKRLQQRANEALTDENVALLRACVESLGLLHKTYAEKIKVAEFERATENVREALAACGYAVQFRKERDGTVVLEASGFPTKQVNVQMSPDDGRMRLRVEDEAGSHCVQDVQSLQAELSRLDMELFITDWGKGNPHSIRTSIEQNSITRS